jgi:hypothetical protein
MAITAQAPAAAPTVPHGTDTATGADRAAGAEPSPVRLTAVTARVQGRRGVLAYEHPDGARQGQQPGRAAYEQWREQRDGGDQDHRLSRVRLALQQTRRVRGQRPPEQPDPEGQQRESGKPPARRQRAAVHIRLAQRLHGSDATGPVRCRPHSGQRHRHPCPECDMEGPDGLADREPVDFPEPEGPITAVKEPVRKSRSTPSRAVTSRWTRRRAVSRTAVVEVMRPGSRPRRA